MPLMQETPQKPKSFKAALPQRFSYHRRTDESDGLGETAHNHLPSLRLKLTSRKDQIIAWLSFFFNGVLPAHHVVPHALGQLFVTLDGEVEAVVGEEAHVNLPILLRRSDK